MNDKIKTFEDCWVELIIMITKNNKIRVKEMEDDFYEMAVNPSHPGREFFINNLEEWVMTYVI